ncbi:unnamed protein product [Ectocarpus sp. CCAP 1310/34]|nr:unnamed protein product [Ectocarpus sp. CCAP 1310/34]
MKDVNLLLKHIETGCLSDPEGVPLYYPTGQNAAGITTHRCVRGTNCTEGYHRYLRRLLSSYCASPALAHSVLLEFNFRWNVRMAVKNRGLPREVGEFFDQYEIEIIQRDTASWYPDNPLFPEWVSALDVADTGERSDLSQSMWGPASGGDAPGDLVDEQASPQHAIPMPKPTHSAKKYAEMMNIGMPCTPVHTGAERRKFTCEMNSYLYVPGEARGRRQIYESINFDRWSHEWNNHCAQIESGAVEWEAVYRKTSHQLESYCKNNVVKRANSRVTMMAVQSMNNYLGARLQEGESGENFDGLVGTMAPPPVQRSVAGGGAAGAEGLPEAGVLRVRKDCRKM